MTDIKIFPNDVTTLMDIVRELRSSGWVQGKDFDFKWVPMGVERRHAIFTFYTEKYAAWFALKYC